MVNTITTVIGWLVGVGGLVGAIAKVYLDLRKDRREELQAKDRLNETLQTLSTDMSEVKSDVTEIKITNDLLIRGQIKSQRFVLQSVIIQALKRGYTTQHELDEVSELFASYLEKGGNGMIAIMYDKFKTLKIKEDIHEH